MSKWHRSWVHQATYKYIATSRNGRRVRVESHSNKRYKVTKDKHGIVFNHWVMEKWTGKVISLGWVANCYRTFMPTLRAILCTWLFVYVILHINLRFIFLKFQLVLTNRSEWKPSQECLTHLLVEFIVFLFGCFWVIVDVKAAILIFGCMQSILYGMYRNSTSSSLSFSLSSIFHGHLWGMTIYIILSTFILYVSITNLMTW